MKLAKGVIDSRLRDSSREICINWRGAALRTGDNVLYKAKNHRKMMAGQIIDIRDEDKIPKHEFTWIAARGKKKSGRMCLIRKLIEMGSRSARRPDPTEYCNVADCIKELVDTYEVEWVPAISVLKPCFILHIDSIQKGLFNCWGIKNLYYI
jgi:hypothetical protein